MKYLTWLGVASIILILTSCGTSIYGTNTGTYSRNDDGTNFNGEWQLVSNRSDDSRDWLDERNRFDADDWGSRSGTNDRFRYGAWFLPDEFSITGDRGTLRIQDESGNVIADIPLDNDYRSGSYSDQDRGVRARWISNRRFEVERMGRNGRRIQQTFTLENRRRQLVVRTEVSRDDGTRSFTRIYERA